MNRGSVPLIQDVMFVQVLGRMQEVNQNNDREICKCNNIIRVIIIITEFNLRAWWLLLYCNVVPRVLQLHSPHVHTRAYTWHTCCSCCSYAKLLTRLYTEFCISLNRSLSYLFPGQKMWIWQKFSSNRLMVREESVLRIMKRNLGQLAIHQGNSFPWYIVV